MKTSNRVPLLSSQLSVVMCIDHVGWIVVLGPIRGSSANQPTGIALRFPRPHVLKNRSAKPPDQLLWSNAPEKMIHVLFLLMRKQETSHAARGFLVSIGICFWVLHSSSLFTPEMLSRHRQILVSSTLGLSGPTASICALVIIMIIPESCEITNIP